MSNLERESEILDILKEKNYATVDYLAKHIHISPSSIRRDLANLEKKGLIKRDHGGASFLPTIPGFAPFSSRLHENKREKLSLVRAAAKLVKPNSSLFVDSSTTTLEIYKYITADMDLTVFTNNMMLAHLLASKKIKTYCIGGRVSERNNVITTGTYALEMLNSIYVDLLFFSSSSLSEAGVISDLDEFETAIRRVMLSHAKTKVFLCPNNRFGKSAPFGLTDVCNVDYVFSNSEFSEAFQRKYPDVEFHKA